MDFPEQPRRKDRENIVPMINVVFLLLIFFLMSATLAPPDPFEVEPPQSTAEETAEVGGPLFLAADGRLAWGYSQGEAVFPALQSAVRAGTLDLPLIIRADREAEAATLATVLARLAAIGVQESELVTGQGR